MKNRKKIMFVFGTRPEAIKMAPVIAKVKRQEKKLWPVIVSTGQHRQMLDQVLRIFKIKPNYDLAIMEKNQTLADIINHALKKLEKVLLQEKPDLLLVQGDTSTAFASALLAYYFKIPIGHVEAGLRTHDKWRPFPEEINRKLIGGVADLHFAPTKTAVDNLIRENVASETIYLTGNTVIDALLAVAARKYNLRQAGIGLRSGKKIVLVTMHRRETFGRQQEAMCRALAKLARKHHDQIEIVWPVHKNPKVSEVVNKGLKDLDNVRLIEPLAYEPFVHLMKVAHLIITDSGGIQEEAPSFGKPVLVMREKTERPEALAAGTVKLVGVSEQEIFRQADRLLADPAEYAKMSQAVNPYGDGQAAARIVTAILFYFGLTRHRPAEFNA